MLAVTRFFGKSSWERTELSFEGWLGSDPEGRGEWKENPTSESSNPPTFLAYFASSASAAATSCKQAKPGSSAASGALSSTQFPFLASLPLLPAGTCLARLIHMQTWKRVEVNAPRTAPDQEGVEAGGLILPSSSLQAAEREMHYTRVPQRVLARTDLWLPTVMIRS